MQYTITLLLSLILGQILSAQVTIASDTSFATVPWLWRNLGPAHANGGLVSDIAVPLPRSPAEPRAGTTMYVAGPGGLFKTVDGGKNWKPLGDDVIANSIGRVVVANTDPNVLWISTGYIDVFGTLVPGRGLFRSLDAGEHWEQAGFERSEFMGAVAIHPKDANTVLACVKGPLSRPSKERGVYRTTDGGKNWTQVLYVNEWTGAVDLSIDPVNPNIIYAVTQQQAVHPRVYVDFGPGSGIYKSKDGGVTWKKMTKGLPKEWGQGSIAVSPASPNIVYALLDDNGPHLRRNDVEGNASDGVYLYRSLDAGESWERGANNFGWAMSYYQNRVFADPVEPGRVYGTAPDLIVSTDTGKTVSKERVNGGKDPHVLWIDPSDNRHMLVGSDRSLAVTETKGKSWKRWDNLLMGRYWDIDVDSREFFYNIYTVAMDEVAMKIPSMTRYDGIYGSDVEYVCGAGEVGHAFVDPFDHTRVYTLEEKLSHAAVPSRWDPETNQCKGGIPIAGGVYDKGIVDLVDGRGDMLRTVAMVSRHDSKVLFVAKQRVWKSGAYNDSQWQAISPEFVKRAPDSATVMGRFEKDWKKVLPWQARVLYNWGAQAATIQAFAESPLDAKVLYAGTRDGTLMVTRDGGKTWVKTSPRPGAPVNAMVSSIVASNFGTGTAYTATHAGDNGSSKALVYKTTDYGIHWRDISSNLPEGAKVWVLAEHFRTPGLLFVGTDYGLYASIDDGATWAKMRGNLPQGGQVKDLVVQRGANDLVVSIWGRGVWVLDDITPLEEWAKATRRNTSPHLFPTRNSIIVNEFKRFKASSEFVSLGPPHGAMISYYVSDAARGLRDTIDIIMTGKDSSNSIGNSEEMVVSFETDTAPGFHRFLWRYGSDAARPSLIRSGHYKVRLRSSGREGRMFTVVRDLIKNVPKATEDSLYGDKVLIRNFGNKAFNGLYAIGNETYKRLDSLMGIIDAQGSSLSKWHTVVDRMRDSVKLIVSDSDGTTSPASGNWSLPRDPILNLAILVIQRIGATETEPLPQYRRILIQQATKWVEARVDRLRQLLEGPITQLEQNMRRTGYASVANVLKPSEQLVKLSKLTSNVYPAKDMVIDYKRRYTNLLNDYKSFDEGDYDNGSDGYNDESR